MSISKRGCTQDQCLCRASIGRLAQLGRAPGLQPGGRGFKSPSVHHHARILVVASKASMTTFLANP